MRLTPVTTTSMIAVSGSTSAVTLTTTLPTSSHLWGAKASESGSSMTDMRAMIERAKLAPIDSTTRYPAMDGSLLKNGRTTSAISAKQPRGSRNISHTPNSLIIG